MGFFTHPHFSNLVFKISSFSKFLDDYYSLHKLGETRWGEWGQRVKFLRGLVLGTKPAEEGEHDEESDSYGGWLKEVGLYGRSPEIGLARHLKLIRHDGLTPKAGQRRPY